MMRRIFKSLTNFVFLLAISGSAINAQMGSGPGDFTDHEGHQMDHNMVVPQIAVGEHYTTTLVLLNLGDTEQMGWMSDEDFRTTGTVYVYKQDGTRLPVSVDGGAPVSKLPFSLDAGTTAHFDLTSVGPDTPGWALIDIDEPQGSPSWGMRDDHDMRRGERVMATVFYTYTEGNQAISRVGVIPSLYVMGRFFTSITAVQSEEDLSTGVAVVNSGSETATIDLKLKDADNRLLATRQLFLQPGNQVARFIPQLFPEDGIPVHFQGFLEIHTRNEGVVTLGMLVSQGILTSIPTLHYGRITGPMR